jgi:hypothetical protein
MLMGMEWFSWGWEVSDSYNATFTDTYLHTRPCMRLT